MLCLEKREKETIINLQKCENRRGRSKTAIITIRVANSIRKHQKHSNTGARYNRGPSEKRRALNLFQKDD